MGIATTMGTHIRTIMDIRMDIRTDIRTDIRMDMVTTTDRTNSKQ